MNSVFNAIYTVWNQIVYAVSHIRFPFDIIDIIVVAFVIYKAIGFLRDSRAGQLVKGLAILFIVFAIATWWKMAALKWFLTFIMNSVIVIIVVVFQPEIRRILEKVGRTNFPKGRFFEDSEQEFSQCIDSVAKAAGVMQESKIGALIVFERSYQLGEIINTGTVIDAKASVSIINNIFFPKSPLHDGAMIIRDGRIIAAGCILPLTQREDISNRLGTRHRAAIGMTENSDAVVLVVSEETGIISIATNGNITRKYNPASADAQLRKLLLENNQDNNTKPMSTILSRIIPLKKNKNDGGDNK